MNRIRTGWYQNVTKLVTAIDAEFCKTFESKFGPRSQDR